MRTGTRIAAVCFLVAFLAVSAGARAADLTIWGFQAFNKAADALIGEQVQAFAKSKGITAEYVVVPANVMNERLAAAIESGSPPDLFMNVGEQAQYFMGLGVTMPLDDVLAELRSKGIFENILPLLMYQDKAHALPLEIDMIPMFARMDLITAAGGPLPDSWEQLRQVCVNMKEKKLLEYPLGLTISSANDAESQIRMLIWSFGGALFSEDGKTITFDTPETRAALEFLDQMFNKDKIISRSSLTWDDAGNNTAYQTGRAAFIINPPSVYSWLVDNNKKMLEDTALIAIPMGPGGVRGSQISCWTWIASNKAKRPELVKDWLRYFYAEDNYRKLIDTCGGRWAPIFPKLFAEMPLFSQNKHFKDFKEMVDAGKMFGYRGAPTALSAELGAARIVSTVVGKILDDRMPVAEATAWGQKEMEKIAAKK